MSKQTGKTVVKYKPLFADGESAFKTEGSLDTITFADCYLVEVNHNGADVGLPFEDCNEEHFAVGILIVTDSGINDQLQVNRVTGQVLILTSCKQKATNVYSRTRMDDKWSEWRTLAVTGMYDKISTPDQLLATVESLVNENTRAKEVEEGVKRSAVDISSLTCTADTESVTITANSMDGEVVHSVEIPAATTEKAGVMSAEDKRTVEDVSMKTKHIHATEADDTIEEIVICNNDETEEIVKINNEGLAAKKIFNLDGEELKPSGLHSIADNHATLEICDEKQQPILTIDFNGNLNTASFNSLNVAKNKFKGKTMLYIGDSISTGNIWHWKGYIKDCIGLDYVDYNISDTINVTPAVGGITIRPHNDDDTRPMNAGAAEVGSGAKSIWWRCCNKRLGIYDFDYINLFGGTNDIYDNNLNVGTIDDTPLLDTDVEDLSALDLSQVSFASAFMGCIEMLQRDFPSKPIFICTLLYNGYARTPDVVKIQMLAAQKYGLKVVPFYYSELNSQNYQWLCSGFHPNQIAARIMEKNFVEYINL